MGMIWSLSDIQPIHSTARLLIAPVFRKRLFPCQKFAAARHVDICDYLEVDHIPSIRILLPLEPSCSSKCTARHRKQMSAGAGYLLLEQERDRLKCALAHLERSVTELRAAVSETGPDPDYKEAIDENITLIAKYRARVAALEDEIQHIKGLKSDGQAQQLATMTVLEDHGSTQHQIDPSQQHRFSPQRQDSPEQLEREPAGGPGIQGQISSSTAAICEDAVQGGGMWL